MYEKTFCLNSSKKFTVAVYLQADLIVDCIVDAGFEAQLIESGLPVNPNRKCRLFIKHMTCTACSSTVEKALKVK